MRFDLSKAMPSRKAAIDVVTIGIGLVVAMTFTVLGWDAQQRTSAAKELTSGDETALQTAVRAAEQLLNLGAANANEELEELRRAATGDFAGQLDTLQTTIAALLAQGEVASTGEVLAAGIEDADGSRDRDSVTVLVAARGTVRNAELRDGQTRDYRMAMALTRSDDADSASAEWKITSVEFLP